MSIRGYGRYLKSDALEVRRQIFHLLGISSWCVPILLFPQSLTLCLMVVVITMNAFVVLRLGPFLRIFGSIIRCFERERNVRKPGIQAFYANSGVFLAFLFFGELSVVGVLVLSVGDALSTLTGRLFGKTPSILNPSKTWEGTLAFFVGTFFVLLPLLGTEASLLISSLSSLAEALDLRIDDNFLLPLFATALTYLV